MVGGIGRCAAVDQGGEEEEGFDGFHDSINKLQTRAEVIKKMSGSVSSKNGRCFCLLSMTFWKQLTAQSDVPCMAHGFSRTFNPCFP